MKIKKSLILLFIFIITLTLSINVFGNTNEDPNITYEEFLQAKENGYIDEDISYEQIIELSELSEKLEEELEKNKDFNLVWDSSRATTQSSIPTLQKGDILVTNGTSSFGLTGHAGIAIGSNSILHIGGAGEKPTVVTRQVFYNRYINSSSNWIKIYRPTNSTYGTNAANWAEKTYKDSNATYKLTNNLTTTNETYCSKIIFQAYNYGANTSDAFNDVYEDYKIFNPYGSKTGFVLPYQLYSYIKTNYIYKIN